VVLRRVVVPGLVLAFGLVLLWARRSPPDASSAADQATPVSAAPRLRAPQGQPASATQQTLPDSPAPPPPAAEPDDVAHACRPRLAWEDPGASGWVAVTLELPESVLPRGQVEVSGPRTGFFSALEDGGHSDVPEGPMLVAPLKGWRFWVQPCANPRDTPSLTVALADGRRAWSRLGNASTLRLKPLTPLVKTDLSGRLLRRGAPVAGVNVDGLLCNGTVTDQGGRFALSCVVLPGTDILRVRAPWYFHATQSEKWFAFDGGPLGDLEVRQRAPVDPGRVGLVLEDARGSVVVTSVIDLGPAWHAGVEVGDEVLEVDGAGVATADEARARLSGAPGAPVRLKLRRGADVFFLEVERQPPPD